MNIIRLRPGPVSVQHPVLVVCAFSWFLCASLATSAVAQSYPTRPVKIIVPFAPGGVDVTARVVADRLSSVLGQPFIVENRAGGAGGSVGAKAVATAEPDG
jgi:tripartite-type tricarboxylate transporter receptor subunit TctC